MNLVLKSRFKLFGGFGLLLSLLGIMLFGAYRLTMNSKVSWNQVNLIGDSQAAFAYVVTFGLVILLLFLFATQCRIIEISPNEISFTNPLVPILKKKVQWSEVDHIILVDEQSRFDSNEAVWLMKSGRVLARFSAFYYSNYRELKNKIPLKSKGKVHVGFLEQLSAVLK